MSCYGVSHPLIVNGMPQDLGSVATFVGGLSSQFHSMSLDLEGLAQQIQAVATADEDLCEANVQQVLALELAEEEQARLRERAELAEMRHHDICSRK